ncbi:MAG: prephenate dehydrogenase [Abditibacteriota bacterium]|nr:prephenate dehydrogenase [Abditibacteriota bacterium]
MEWINRKNIHIVGLGLIGGSYAMALKRMGFSVSAIDKNPDAIEYAVEKGIIDHGATIPDETIISAADAIIFALYPNVFIDWMSKYKDLLKPGIYITDVTGVKSAIVYRVQDILGDRAEFIASHPMAGKEVGGVRNSDDLIFRDANYIVVPTDRNTEGAVNWCKRLGKLLGFKNISILSPEEHDRMIAYVSQLTHCIAVSLMTEPSPRNAEKFTGDSFRDLTRIARINENMWSELFFMNKDALLGEMDAFIKEITDLRNLIADDDVEGVKEKMRLSTARKTKFNAV